MEVHMHMVADMVAEEKMAVIVVFCVKCCSPLVKTSLVVL